MIRSSVDLPEPLGPSSAVSEPSGTSSVTRSSAVKSPKFLVTAWTSILICGLRRGSLRSPRAENGHCEQDEQGHDRELGGRGVGTCDLAGTYRRVSLLDQQ